MIDLTFQAEAFTYFNTPKTLRCIPAKRDHACNHPLNYFQTLAARRLSAIRYFFWKVRNLTPSLTLLTWLAVHK